MIFKQTFLVNKYIMTIKQTFLVLIIKIRFFYCNIKNVY